MEISPTITKKSKPEEGQSSYHVPNLDRAFLIMELLGDSASGLTLTDLVKLTDLPQNSIFRICRTLETLGYLSRDSKTKRHQLTRKIIRLGLGAISPGQNTVAVAAPYLKRIAEETGETCCLGTITGHKGVILAVEEGKHPFRFHIDLGTSFDLHTAAPGKAMIATLSNIDTFIDGMEFPVYNENTISSRDDFRKHIECVTKESYAVDNEEEHHGQRCVGAAIRPPNTAMPCSIWLTAPSSRLPKKDFKKIGNLIRKACAEIEQELISNIT